MSIQLPKCLIEPMRLYRVADAPLPKEYELFHHLVARVDKNLRVNSGEWLMLDDIGAEGRDMGGMPVYQCVVAVKDNSPVGWKAHKMQWHESGAWFSGFFRFAEADGEANDRALMTYPRNWTEDAILAKMLAAA